MNRRPTQARLLFAIVAALAVPASGWASEQDSVQTAQPARQAAEDALSFDYFENNWNVIGLKDYVHGARVTPDNQLLLANNARVQILIGADRKPLSRANPKRATNYTCSRRSLIGGSGPDKRSVLSVCLRISVRWA